MSTDVTSDEHGNPVPVTGTQLASDRMPRESVTVIVTLLVATFVVILNETIMNVALQRLMTDLNVDAPTVQWLSTGFMLTMAVVIPTTGFILQRLTTRAAFLLAIGLFSAGTLLAAVAPGFAVLLLARIVQAGGTAIMLPLLMTTILTLVPLSRRGAVMGNVTIAISVAPALGPTVSGIILDHFSWRFMFVFVLPVALLAMAIGAKFLTNVGERGHVKLDFVSVVLTVPAFGGLVYGLSQIGGHSGAATLPIAALVIGVLCMVAFVFRQLQLQKSEAPLLDLRAFKFRMFTVSVLLLVVAMMALFGVVILLPLYLQNVLHLQPMETGLALLPGGLAMGLLGPVVGRLFDKLGPFPLTVSGSILLVLTLWQFSMLTADSQLWWVIVLYAVLSLGLALLFTPAFTTGLNPLPPHLYSHGSAIMSTLQQVAGAAGTALLVSIFAVVSAVSGFVAGMQAAFLTATLIAVAAVVLSAMMRKTQGAAAH
ncbi:DHA2 family efflux MFS transporter permease subunit [Arthrobacter sp. MA-N2]|uniref:DHA2 family efflux MFS transporter permease subunit n=1 Tax=Arthrobacter sp. MA-N2 TaxID=1101188 RepID=UPI000488CFCE|nr:DHA2 family efflux MFS transporter permease subunit [Arthrobacter sp. MA-N2]